MPITPEENRRRVKATMAERDRINIILPKGTNNRIRAAGYAPATFARNLVMSELERLDALDRHYKEDCAKSTKN